MKTQIQQEQANQLVDVRGLRKSGEATPHQHFENANTALMQGQHEEATQHYHMGLNAAKESSEGVGHHVQSYLNHKQPGEDDFGNLNEGPHPNLRTALDQTRVRLQYEKHGLPHDKDLGFVIPKTKWSGFDH